MITRGRRANRSAWRAPTSPTRSSEPQSEMTSRSYGARPVGVGPEALDAGDEVVQRRDRVGADRRRRRRPCASTSRTTAERRAERVGVGVLVADRQHAARATEAVHDDLRDGVQVRREVDAHREPLRGALRDPVRRRRPVPGPARPRTRADGLADRRRRLAREVVGLVDARRPASAATRRAGRPASGLSPDSSSASSCRMRVPALGRVVELDVEVRDPLDPEPLAQLVPDERHRVAQRRDRGVALGRLADDAHPDLGVAQVRRRLDLGDRGEPDPRIGHVPRRRSTPISCRSSSSTRSVALAHRPHRARVRSRPTQPGDRATDASAR